MTDATPIVALQQTAQDYPSLLREIPDAPRTLYLRGHMFDPSRPAVAIVGTRRYTRYGKQWTEKIAGDLARMGVVIVSGLARGIDTSAHRAALSARGSTVAVLGTGIDDDTIFPRQNLTLAHDILQNGGCLLSEYPAGTHGTVFTFPARNRLIAGMCHGVLVMEAPFKSGALITARMALEYNRDVFTIPHALGTWTGQGCNKLLAAGAHLITCAEDVLEALGMEQTAAAKTPSAASGDTERKILNLLTRAPLHIDQLIEQSGLDRAALMTAVTMLELKGAIKNTGDMYFTLT